MSFRTNDSQQLSLFDSFNVLTAREQKALERSWAKVFAEEIFPTIDEGRFAVLYSDKASRPNTPVNIIIGALILKELLNLSDDEVVENLMLDFRFRYALHTTSFEEQPLSDKSLTRFRQRCYDYEETTGIDLYHGCVTELAGKTAKLMELDGRIRRMDSLATVNLGFIKQGAGFAANFLTDEMMSIAALYAPLDGMNEKGLCVSVNMIQDSATIQQNTDKPDLTTTTAIRLMLDKAANAREALALLEQYDLHASMNYMIHFAIADNTGNSVAVEYVNNEMIVTATPVLTNFYLAEGEKQGTGTQQSHTRFDILTETLEDNSSMTALQVRDALDSVSKDNFGEFESTEWSVVFDQSALTAVYYHRENYKVGYSFELLNTK